MSGRLSLRAQIAVALALTLVLAAVLNGVIALALLQRAAGESAREANATFATSLARRLGTECAGAGDRCLEAAAAREARGELRVRVQPAFEQVPALAGSAPLPDGRVLVVSGATAQRRGGGTASLLVWYIGSNALVAFLFGLFLLNRFVSRPVDRLAEAAERIGRLELDEAPAADGPVLGQLGIAFERMARSLRSERDRVGRQIDELRSLNRQLEEARDSLVRSENLATTGRLAAGIAHEIGNPLGAILGYLELARGRATPEAREYLDRIDGEVGRIDRTIRELLEFSRPAAAAEPPVAVVLQDAVERAVRLASVQKRLKQVAFSVDVPADLEVLAAPHHLSQVLVNVLLNAGDAMKAQGSIRIRAAKTSRGGRPAIELAIADTGPGIAEADLPRIFDPFFTTKPPGEGTGLGLSICHRIMESFGGEVRAANAPEGGAVFTLVFRTPA